MSGFAALMALSASQTKESQSAVQVALAQRQRKEEARRKQQEEQERKERELEHKLRIKHFEDEKRAQERRLQLEQEEKAREEALQRRAEEQRDALRYGPKKSRTAASSGDSSPRWPSSATHARSREDVRRRRFPSDDDDADSSGGSPGLALTREEKRERKLQAELNRTFHSAKRTTHTNGHARAGRPLPGGAYDVMTTPGAVDSGSSSQSVKARIAAMPNTLTKLNVVKRDTRTIDEILQDRAKARDVKVLDGDEAREFNDWFGKAKKKEPAKKSSQPLTPSPTSGANTPVSRVSSPYVDDSLKSTKLSQHKTKPQAPSGAGTKAPSTISKSSRTTTITNSSSSSVIKPKTASINHSSTVNGRSFSKKRPRSRSSSESLSPPPSKKRASSSNASRSAISAEIWKMFGKDRSTYVQQDVLSDDEDMEADATLLEREELRSSRIARAEEEEAMEAEKRHEQEKRRRKKEKELRERRG